jgi:hypothetical protein
LLKQTLAIAFIFVCTTIAWLILGETIFTRTYGSNQQLQGHVASTWGSEQQQSPPTAHYTVTETTSSTTVENGKLIVHNDKVQRLVPLALEASRVHVNFHLDPRQKGLLWYRTYAVAFSGDYTFRNSTAQTQTVDFRLKFPAQKALYDGLQMKINEQLITPLPTTRERWDRPLSSPARMPSCMLPIARKAWTLGVTSLPTASRSLAISRWSCERISVTSTSPPTPFHRPRSCWFPKAGN